VTPFSERRERVRVEADRREDERDQQQAEHGLDVGAVCDVNDRHEDRLPVLSLTRCLAEASHKDLADHPNGATK